MKKQKFPDWDPVVGERALIPSGEVCALTESDIDAIRSGHTGYYPLGIKIVDKAMLDTVYESKGYVIDILLYNEKTKDWWGVARVKDPSYALRAARRYYGNHVAYAVED